MVVLGYTGNFIFRTGFKGRLRRQLAEAKTAVKISNSPELDRSLYVTGDLALFYTFSDPSPFGTVRHYEKIDSLERAGNASFLQPCRVEWQALAPSAIKR